MYNLILSLDGVFPCLRYLVLTCVYWHVGDGYIVYRVLAKGKQSAV